MPEFIQPTELIGRFVRLREVEIEDAAVILKLRRSKRANFINHTDNDLQKQISYLERYKELNSEYYFVIENKAGEVIGTCRIYGMQNGTAKSGSWILREGTALEEMVEQCLIFKNYFFNVLGFRMEYFEVMKGNNKVINYHKLWGAEITHEDGNFFYFELSADSFARNRSNFSALLSS